MVFLVAVAGHHFSRLDRRPWTDRLRFNQGCVSSRLGAVALVQGCFPCAHSNYGPLPFSNGSELWAPILKMVFNDYNGFVRIQNPGPMPGSVWASCVFRLQPAFVWPNQRPLPLKPFLKLITMIRVPLCALSLAHCGAYHTC